MRSSAPVVAEPAIAPAPPRRAWWLLSLTAFGLVLAGTSTGAEAPAPAVPLQVGLVAAAGGVAVAQSGVLVVPLELRNAGRAVAVDGATVYAEPVRQDARVQPPDEVGAGSTRSFVALLAPDCRLLRPGSPIGFRATVRLRVGAGASMEDRVLDLGAEPGVRRAVAGLCR